MIDRTSLSRFTAAIALLAAVAGSVATANPEGALQAKQMLAPRQWAEAVEIKNSNRSSRYPETVYGTVFEFNDTLWFYTSTGSQPLMASRNRTHEFKENLLPLLRTMEPGFTSFVPLTPEPSESSGSYASLKNGCVIESIFSLQENTRTEEPILEARLLLYSSKNPQRSSESRRATGHCVLVYETPSGMFFVDPPNLDVTGQLREVRDWDPISIAREIESRYGVPEIEDAFFEPFKLPASILAQSN